jgi:CRISPR-associated protein (TIGR02584 family)
MKQANHASRHILVAVAGLTPQIITETLYALTQEHGERIDEIRVITTLAGRDRIKQLLLDPDKGKFFAFCRDYHLDPASIKFDETTIALLHTPDGRVLEDIRSPEENEYAADQICDMVRQLTRDPNTRIHASAAGGRKTMSVYLTTALQLFGRAQDRLSHVLVSEAFETHPEFFYKPPTPRELEIRDRQGTTRRVSTANAEIHLADIPFIRLRGLIAEWLDQGGSYNDYVKRSAEILYLVESAPDLRLSLRDKTVVVAGQAIKLTEKEFFIYALFAHFRAQERGDQGFVALTEITVTDLDAVFRRITAARGRERSLEEVNLVPPFRFLQPMANQVATHKKIDSQASFLKEVDPQEQASFLQARAKINRKLEAASLPERYHITSRGERGSLRYGLGVAPERIIWA